MSVRGTYIVEARFGDRAAVDITPLTREFTWVESLIDGGFLWELRCTTDGWDEWDDVLVGREPLKLRVAYQSSQSGREETTPWRTAIVDTSGMSFRSTALSFVLHGKDRRLDMMQLDRTRAWLGTTVSDVVQSVASEYGFDAVVEATTDRSDRWQMRTSDWAYIQGLAQGAASASGRGDFFVWMDEDQIRLGAPRTQRSSDRRHIMQEVETRVDRVLVGYHGREIDRRGGATLRAVGLDVDTKEQVVFTLDAGESGSYPALGRRVPRAQDEGLRVVPTFSGYDKARESVHGEWGRVAPRYFSLRLDTRPDLTLRPGMLVELQGNLGRGQETPFLGRFAVLEVKHHLAVGDPSEATSGGLVTTAVCYRREAYAGSDEPTGASAAQTGTHDRYRAGGEQLPSSTVVAEVLDG